MKIAIIGAGACGLMLASRLDKAQIEYTIFNKGKVGNKILASGNGRCNIANANLDDFKYHNNPLACKIVRDNQSDFFNILKEYKIYTKTDDEGRMYPISESSLSVLNAILKNIHKNIIDWEVKNINISQAGYYVDNHGPFDNVVIATGTGASYKTFARLKFLENLKMKDYYPSLVGFKANGVKELSGARCKANVTLVKNNKDIYSERGEVIFKDDGISGICVMNLSSLYSNDKDKNNYQIRLDLSPDMEYDSYETVLQPKVYEYVMKNNVNVHNLVLDIRGTYSFEFAQVCSGGIDLSEVNPDLSLKKYNGIYAGGEVLDVDGLCGGYNLMFAFCSALEIFKGVIK